MNIFTFWNDAPLSYIERLCLSSMVASGHSVDLYSYDTIADIPAGVTLRDAGLIFPKKDIVRDKATGSIALFADQFRYEGLRRGAGIWLDTDVLLLRSLDGMGDHVFGWEDYRTINSAVLLIPPESECLKALQEFAHSRVPVPPYWTQRRQYLQRARALIGIEKSLEELGWGMIGPKAMTHFVKSKNLVHRAQPFDVFYP